MKRLSDQVTLLGKFESISVSELRKMPGEVLACVALGKTFLIVKNGKPIAVLSKPPGETLTVEVGPDGKINYRP